MGGEKEKGTLGNRGRASIEKVSPNEHRLGICGKEKNEAEK